VLWTIVALVATTGLIIGYKLSDEDSKNSDSPIANAADNPANPDYNYVSPTISPILSPTETPTETPTIAPTVTPEPTKEPTPKPTVTIAPTLAPTIAPQKDDEADTEDSPKMIALTFDDGPYPPVTERILKTLADNDAKATFFVVGNRLKQYKDTLKLEYEGGNQIASHTYSHKDLTALSIKEMLHEVNYANQLINKIVPVGETYLRPPFGRKNDLMKENIGVPMIFWSLDTLDWSSRDANAIYKEIMDTVKDGDILIMHDLYPSTADAMELVVPKLIEEGYQLVTVKELLEAKGIDIVGGNVYYNGR
jgi:peptidoglycan/xylan/chitin deacetylase (PgdA/CDA1 family)